MKSYLIYNAQDEIDAHLTQGFLSSHGINANIGGSTAPMGRMFDETVAARLPKGLYVLQKDKKKALDLLRTRSPSRASKKVIKRADHAFAFVIFLAVSCLVIVLSMHG